MILIGALSKGLRLPLLREFGRLRHNGQDTGHHGGDHPADARGSISSVSQSVTPTLPPTEHGVARPTTHAVHNRVRLSTRGACRLLPCKCVCVAVGTRGGPYFSVQFSYLHAVGQRLARALDPAASACARVHCPVACTGSGLLCRRPFDRLSFRVRARLGTCPPHGAAAYGKRVAEHRGVRDPANLLRIHRHVPGIIPA